MDVELEIVWDGTVPGLHERRLSLEAFGPALRELLAAIRRIASDLEMQAREPSREAGRGRLAREASNLDVQVAAVRSNSPVTISTAIVPVEQPARPLINDLPDRALDVFLQGMEREAKAAPSHYRVRKFLKALPPGLTRQTYIHRSSDGTVRRRVEIGEMAFAESRSAPHLIEFTGVVVGIGFEPGRSEVKIRADSSGVMTISATAEQVDAALALRRSQVHVLAVAESSSTRLLRLGVAGPEIPDPDARMDAIFSTWRGLLHRLAQ